MNMIDSAYGIVVSNDNPLLNILPQVYVEQTWSPTNNVSGLSFMFAVETGQTCVIFLMSHSPSVSMNPVSRLILGLVSTLSI